MTASTPEAGELATPRTDEAAHNADLFRPGRLVVSVEHARQLERELTELTAALDAAKREVGEKDPRRLSLDTDKQVFFYEQDFYVLSNFSSFTVKWRGLLFPTSEHAYHWAKFRNRDVTGAHCEMILASLSAHEAFKYAERYKAERRLDWDAVKVPIMREILRAKVEQHEYVRRKLLATGERTLIENSWRDDYWGWGPNRDGKNMLGKLWMEIRAALAAKSTEPKEG